LVFATLWNSVAIHLPGIFANDVIENEIVNVPNEKDKLEYLTVDPLDVPLVSEDVSRRTENEKHFRKLDGTYEVSIYDEAVHYYKDGKWEDIDNSLQLDVKSNTYVNKANKFEVNFPKNITGNQSISVNIDNYNVSWNVLDIEGNKNAFVKEMSKKSGESTLRDIEKISSSVVYQNIMKQVDLEYVVSGSRIKENIILNEYVPDFQLAFQYNLKELQIIDIDGRISFVNDDNEVIFTIGDLFMMDQVGNISNDVFLDYKIISKNTYEIILTVDDEWLRNATYPVLIDPTLDSRVTPISIYDTYVSQANPDTNYYNSTEMIVSGTSVASQYRGLIYFIIPPSVMNQAITYSHMYMSPKTVTNGSQINLHKNIAGFSSAAVTWNNRPSIETSVIDYHTIITGNPYIFDITEAVKEWQATGNNVTTGFTIGLDENYGKTNIFYQKEINDYRKPVITIGYEDPSGLKDYWTYTSQDMGMLGAGYISDYTGNLTWVRTDFSLQNEYNNLSLSFFHNNFTRSEDIGYGDGWRSNFNMQILYDASVNLYYMRKPDGSKVYFIYETTESQDYGFTLEKYIAEDGSRVELKRLLQNGYLNTTTVSTTSGIDFSFDSAGRLVGIRNTATDHRIYVHYTDSSQKISHILDDANNKILFTYTNNRLSKTQLYLKQSDSSLRLVEEKNYFYDGYNNIDYITQGFRYGSYLNTDMVYSHTLHYNFDSSNRLISAKSEPSNSMVSYTYDAKGRANHISSFVDALDPIDIKAIGDIGILYSSGKTVYTNQRNESITYLFDHYGHTINAIDSYANSTHYQYSGLFTNASYTWDPTNGYQWYPSYRNNHKLISSSDVIKQQQNPITNHGFEEGNIGWTLASGSDAIYSYSQNESVLGDKSLRLTKNSTNAYVYQTVYLGAGDYTITGWIKHTGGTPGAFIDVSNVTTKGVVTKIYNKSGWEKYQLTFSISTNRTVEIRLTNETQSTAYFDNVQISEGFIDTRYNAITNNSFERDTTGWTLSGASRVAIYETGVMDDILGEYAIKIDGNGSTYKYFKQNATNLVSERGTYMVGGWAKADAVPSKEHFSETITDGRFFGLSVKVCNIDPEFPGEPPTCRMWKLPFNSSIEDWQYQMTSFDIPDFVTLVEIEGIYQGEGTAYFDNIQLYHDKMNTSYSYHSESGNLNLVSQSNGKETILIYDEQGNIIKTISYSIGDSTLIYDEFGYLIQIIQSSGETIELIYDGAGNIIEYIAGDGQGSFYAYNIKNQLEEVTKKNVKTLFKYNAGNNMLEEIKYGYDKSLSEFNQDQWFMHSTTYIANGQYISSSTDEFGNTNTNNVDRTIGLITSIIDPKGNTSSFIYNEYGVIEYEQNTDFATGATIHKSYIHDSSGRLWKIQRDGYVYEFVYNDLGQVYQVIVAGQSLYELDFVEEEHNGTIYYTNKLNQQTYGNGDVYSFTYTQENQIKTIKFKNELRFQYDYDASGRLTVLNDIHNAKIYFYNYDLSGKLTEILDKDGNSMRYSYDESGNVEWFKYTISGYYRGVHYIYNQVTGEYEHTEYQVGGKSISKNYNYENDSLRRLESIDFVIDLTTFSQTFVYDNQRVQSGRGNATTRIYQVIYEKNETLQYIHQYDYDENHNIKQISIGLPGVLLEQYDYKYDGFNQLIQEDIKINGQISKTMVYTYNNQGNITSVKEYLYQVTSGTPITEKRMFYTYVWKDQLSKIEYYVSGTLSYTQTITYDSNGNITKMIDTRSSYLTINYAWEGRDLTRRQQYTSIIDLKYDDQGIRTNKSSGGITTTYTLNGYLVLLEKYGTSTIYYTYDQQGSLLSMNYNGTEFFYITNLQGDIIEMVDINGNTVVKYRYDAWGNIIYSWYDTGLGYNLSTINPYRYRGYRYDNDLKLYYLQSRYYDPSIGRFINADSVNYLDPSGYTGLNLYAYCGNNPVMYSDITGYSPELVMFLVKLAGGSALLDGPLPVGDAIAILLLATAAIIMIANATETVHTRKHQDDYSVYMCYDKQGELFYVGISNDVERRIGEHMRNPDFLIQYGGRYDVPFSNISLAQARVIETGIILGHDGLTNVRYSIGEKRYSQRSLIWNKIKYDIFPLIP
jgi:RHS repeat-associated protein